MRNSPKVLAVGGVFLSLAVGAGLAAGPSGPMGNRFGRLLILDQDHDKAVTEQEFEAQQSRRFAERDANKDGVLGADEIARSTRRKSNGANYAQRLFQRFDADKDGKLTWAEFEQGEKASFAKRDKNTDGKLTGEETSRWFNRRGAPRPGGTQTLDEVLARSKTRFVTLDTNADGTVLLTEVEAADAERQAYRVKREMHRFDANHDGKVTQDEYMMPAKRRFSSLDLDNDGRISASDLPPNVRVEWSTSK